MVLLSIIILFILSFYRQTATFTRFLSIFYNSTLILFRYALLTNKLLSAYEKITCTSRVYRGSVPGHRSPRAPSPTFTRPPAVISALSISVRLSWLRLSAIAGKCHCKWLFYRRLGQGGIIPPSPLFALNPVKQRISLPLYWLRADYICLFLYGTSVTQSFSDG